VAHVDGLVVVLERTLDGDDGTIDARAVPAGLGKEVDYYGSGPTHPHHQHTKDAPTVLQGG
jgi:hypothetical protein